MFILKYSCDACGKGITKGLKDVQALNDFAENWKEGSSPYGDCLCGPCIKRLLAEGVIVMENVAFFVDLEDGDPEDEITLELE